MDSMEIIEGDNEAIEDDDKWKLSERNCQKKAKEEVIYRCAQTNENKKAKERTNERERENFSSSPLVALLSLSSCHDAERSSSS